MEENMLNVINRQTGNVKYLDRKKIQKLPFSERLKISAKGATSVFEGETVHISSGVTNMPLPPEQDEIFLIPPQREAIKPVEKEVNLPVYIKDNTTGQKLTLRQLGNSPAIAMFPDESSAVNENSPAPPSSKGTGAKELLHLLEKAAEANTAVTGFFIGGVALATAISLISGPLGSVGMAVTISCGAIFGGLPGAKLGLKVSELAGKAGTWIGKKVAGDEQVSRSVAKACLPGMLTPAIMAIGLGVGTGEMIRRGIEKS